MTGRVYFAVELSRTRTETASVVVALPTVWTDPSRDAWLADHAHSLAEIASDWELESPSDADFGESRSAGPLDMVDIVVDAEGTYHKATGDDRRQEPNHPPEDAWVTLGDHRWTTDGAVLVREDGPLPRRAVEWLRGDRRPLPKNVVALLAFTPGMLRALTRADRPTRRCDGRLIAVWSGLDAPLWLDEQYTPLARDGVKLCATGGPLDIVVGLRASECVLAVMPCREPE